MLNTKLTDADLETLTQACRLVVNFKLAGECPVGFSRARIERLAELIDLLPLKRFHLPHITHRVFLAGQEFCLTNEITAQHFKRRGYRVEAL